MTIPNMLTILRILLVPVFAVLFLMGMQAQAILVFALAGITDLLDGWIARKFNMESDAGKLLDPLADKMMALCVVAVMTYVGYLPYWLLIAFAAKEIFMVISSSVLYKKEVVVQSNLLGKASTVLFYIAVFTLYFKTHWGIIMMYFALFASLLALLNYIMIHKKRMGEF